jgi:hypothetical protein
MSKIIEKLQEKESYYIGLNKAKEEVKKFTYSIITESYGEKGLFLVVNDDEISAIKLFEDCQIDINGICGGGLDQAVTIDILKTIVELTNKTILFTYHDYLIHAFKTNSNNEVIDFYENMISEFNAKKAELLNGSEYKKIVYDISIGSGEHCFRDKELHFVVRTYKDEDSCFPNVIFINISKDTLIDKSYLGKLGISDKAIQDILTTVKKYTSVNIDLK